MELAKTVKTVACKLATSPEQLEALEATLKAFNEACNSALEKAKKLKTANKFRLQQACYRELKERFGLTANLAVRAIARASNAYKAKGDEVKGFNPTSVDYDQRIFSFIEPREMVSLSTVRGRIKVPLLLGNYQRRLLKGQKPTHATLVKRKGSFYINITASTPVPRPTPKNDCQVVGVDLGINNLATTSNGLRFPGKQTVHTRRRFQHLRQALQAKGTRATKKLLKQLSGKESRIIRWINHNISRRIIDSLKEGDVIVMEKLTHIREGTRVRKKQRYIHSSWPFSQLQRFIEYKALERAIPVIYVDPQNSSHTCPRCGQFAIRNSHNLHCPSCGYRNHADFAASYELSNRGRALLDGLPVSQPLISATAEKAHRL